MQRPDWLHTDGRPWERGFRGRHVRAAWTLPVAVLMTARLLGEHDHDLGVASAAWLGLAAGIAWQLLAPRDLGDRLRGPAVVTAVALVLRSLGSRPESGAEVAYLSAAAILAGLVLAEWWLRERCQP